MVSMGSGIFIPNRMMATGTMIPATAMQSPMMMNGFSGGVQSNMASQQALAMAAQGIPVDMPSLGVSSSSLPLSQQAFGFSGGVSPLASQSMGVPTASLPFPSQAVSGGQALGGMFGQSIPAASTSSQAMNQMFLMANNFALAGSMLTQFSGMLQMLMQGMGNSQPVQTPQPLSLPPSGQGSGTSTSNEIPTTDLLKGIMALLPNLMALAQPQTATPNYGSGNNSRYWGDPHLVGFDGEQYDVMGQGGNIYNMLSDKNVQYNTTFINWGKPGADGVQPTVIGEAGIQVGDHLVYFDRSGKAPTVNGKSLSKDEKADLGNGRFAQWDGNKLVVKTDEYTIDLQVKEAEKDGGYIDSNVVINDGINPLADGVSPHGLLGQTADEIKGARKGGDGNQNIAKQGGDVIDGVVDDYKVNTLWDNDFKYNRFQAEPENNVLDALISALEGLAKDLAA